MRGKKLVFCGLVFLVAAWASGVSASVPVAGRSQALPTWRQANTSGFGDPQASAVNALEVFNGYLYAGTHNAAVGARLFRSPDGGKWAPVTEPGFGVTHDYKSPAILDLAVFNGRLYASTGRGDGPGQIWRTSNGTIWSPMVIHGFGNQDTVDITALAVYGGWLYAGARNLISGAQIWRSFSGDSNTWTQVAPAPGMAAANITGTAIFGGALYAAVESSGAAQIWRTTGGNWTTAISNGFGNRQTTSTGGLAEFSGALYVGAGNTTEGAQLWRTTYGTNWTQAIQPGFGNPQNEKVETVFVFQNQLYASAKNTQAGLTLWRLGGDALWEPVNQPGFGNSHNTGSNGSSATADFLGQLYIGTLNTVEGGQIWRMQQQLITYLPILRH